MTSFSPFRLTGLLAASALLVLSGCVGTSIGTDANARPDATPSKSATPSTQSSETSTPDQPSQPPVEQPTDFDAYAFSANTLNGSSFDVDSLRGKPTVFWFWTPWCTVCRSDAPGIASLQDELGDDINFVGVAAQGTANEMVTFAAETGVTGFPHLADLDSSIWAHFGVPYQPSYVFVDATGTSTLSVGSRSISELEAELRELLG